MSNFIVSARKYRPVRFEDVVGQEHVSRTLKNALQTDHLAHAFLFCGPRGVGKTTCARILAKVLNCQHPTPDFEPCNTCDNCQAFAQNASFNITELDAASNNSVEHIRALIDQVRFQPQQGRYKVFIIDEVHMLSQQAFNAFLKTLEEPPPYAVFILATTEKHKIIPTILSRCQIFDFRRIQIPDMVEHLQTICRNEGIQADPDALHIIAQKADGALRDALSIFDRIVSFSGNKVTYEEVISNLNILDYDYFFRLMERILLEDAAGVLLLFDEILRKGFDPELFINGLAEHIRNLLVCKDPETIQLLEAGENLRERYEQQARLSPDGLLLTALSLANDCDVNFKMARNKRLHTEMCLIRMTYSQRAFRLAPGEGPAAPDAEKKKTGSNDLNTPARNAAAGPDPAAGTTSPPASEKEQMAEASPAVVVQENNSPTPAQEEKPALRSSKKHSLTQVHLDTLLAEVKEDIAQQPGEIPELSLPSLNTAWEKYIEGLDKETVKMILKSVSLDLQEDNIIVKVGTRLAESAIREESGLMDFLRSELQHPEVTMTILIDETLVTEAPKRKKNLTAKEKFLLMRETNPHVYELLNRFELRPDDD